MATAGTRNIGGAKPTITLEGIKQVNKVLKILEDRAARKYARAGVSKVGTQLKRRMKKRAPDATQTGTELLWSKKLKAKYAAKPRMKNTIKARPSSKWRSAAKMAAQGVVGVAVGPEWPYGAVVHLLEFGHKGVFWGRSGGGLSQFTQPANLLGGMGLPAGEVKPYPFVEKAFDDVRPMYAGIMKRAFWEGIQRDVKANRKVFKDKK